MSWRLTLLQGLAAAGEVLAAHRLRSALTLLGVVAGVAGVLAIDAYGRYASAQVAQRLGNLGSNLVSIGPDFQLTRGAHGIWTSSRSISRSR